MSLPDAFFSVVYDLSAPVRQSQLRVAVSRVASLDQTRPELWEGPATALFASTHAVVADKRSALAFSPVIYTPGARRHRDHALAVTLLVLDFDHVSTERAEATRQRTRALASLVHTTWSHGAQGVEDCCFRVILFLSRPLRMAEAPTLLALAHDQLGDSDPTGRQLHRLYLNPSCPRERLSLARIERNNGWLLDVDAALSTGSLPSPAVPR